MRESVSLAQELRAIRNGGKTEMIFKKKGEFGHPDRPWQEDIDRLEQTLQEVLRSVAQLAGVELPGAPAAAQGNGDSQQLQLNKETLKDRIRNDLEAYSVKTAVEVAKKAEEQTRAALGGLETEVSGQIDRMAREFREKFVQLSDTGEIEAGITQHMRDRVADLVHSKTDEFARWVWLTCQGTGTPIPEQLQKMLEPYVQEAAAQSSESLRQQVEARLAESQSQAQQGFESALKSFQDRVAAAEHGALETWERNSDSVAQHLSERINATAEESAKKFEGRIGGEIESATGRFQSRLEEMSAGAREALQRQEEAQAEGFSRRLGEATNAAQEKQISEITGRIEHTAADIIESSVQHLHQQAEDAVDHSKEELKGFLDGQMDEVRQQIMETVRSVHESLSEDTARVSATLGGLDQELAAIRDRHIASSEEQLSTVIQETLGSLTSSIRQIADTQLGEMKRSMRDFQSHAASEYASQLKGVTEGHYQNLLERFQKEAGEAGSRVAEEVRATSETVMQDLSDKLNASVSVLREEAVHATSRIESSVKNSLEAYRHQLTQITSSGLEEQRKAITDSMAALHARLRQAAELLFPGTSGK